MTPPHRKRILIVDDDPQMVSLLGRLLERAGYSCTVAGGAGEARLRLREESFEILLVDVHMPGGTGFAVVREALAEFPRLSAVMLSGHYHAGLVDIAHDCGASGLISKPFTPEELLAALTKALERRRSPSTPGERRSYRAYSPQERLQIVAEGLTGACSVAELCREHGISEALYHAWHERALRALAQGGPARFGGSRAPTSA